MQIIELDAISWTNVLDFYHDLFAALGAPSWHGHSIDALIDSMIWGGINKIDPPYTIRIRNTLALDKKTLTRIEQLRKVLVCACAEFREREGQNIAVKLEILS